MDGHCHPKALAKLAQASRKNKRAELTAALQGLYSSHFCWLLPEVVQELAFLDNKLEPFDKRLAKQLQPHADLILRLCTIPDIDFTTAAVILAEIGFDMSRRGCSPPGKLGMTMPGNNESAGKHNRVAPAKATAICEAC